MRPSFMQRNVCSAAQHLLRSCWIVLAVVGSAVAAASAPASGAQVMEQESQGTARTLSYEGATTIGNNIIPDAARLFTAKTGVAFSAIGGAGADAGFKAAVEGRASFGGVARELTAAEKTKVGGSEVIGYDVMGVFVYAGNPVTSLTRAHLKQIFTGQISNWKQFGGPDRSITVYSEKLAGGRATVKAFKDLVLCSENYGPVKELEDAIDCLKDVTQDPGGIAASSMSFAVPGVKALAVDGATPNAKSVQDGSYPLKRPLVLVTKDPPTGDVKAFLDFMLTPEAQAIVAKNFVPAR